MVDGMVSGFMSGIQCWFRADNIIVYRVYTVYTAHIVDGRKQVTQARL